MRQPRARASAMSGVVSSSSGSAAYRAIRQPGRRCSQRSTLSATSCAAFAVQCERLRAAPAVTAGKGLRGAADLRAILAAARSAGFPAERRQLPVATADSGAGSVTRLCRCEPLLSDQSNKWDELQQVRLSARGGLAQFCPQALMSRGVSIRARGNPARLSNTAGDAGSTLH